MRILFYSFAVIPRNIKVGSLVLGKPRAMGARRNFSNSVAATAKLSKSIDIEAKARNNVVKVKGSAEFENLKRKAKSSSSDDQSENATSLLKVYERKQTKRRVREALVEEDNSVEIKTSLLKVEQELSIKTNEVTGKKHGLAKRRVSSKTTSTNLGTSDKVYLFENQNEHWTVLTHKKPMKGWIPYNPRTMRPPPLTGETKYVKLMSWNVNGLRALKLEGFSLQLAEREDFDVLCLQETKLQAFLLQFPSA